MQKTVHQALQRQASCAALAQLRHDPSMPLCCAPPAWLASVQVHSSDVPETANITKCLAVACAISFTGVGALVLLLALADPTKLNWWHWWNVTLDTESELGQPIITNVSGAGLSRGGQSWGLSSVGTLTR